MPKNVLLSAAFTAFLNKTSNTGKSFLYSSIFQVFDNSMIMTMLRISLEIDKQFFLKGISWNAQIMKMFTLLNCEYVIYFRIKETQLKMLAAQRCFWNQKLVLRNKDAMISLHYRLKTVATNVKELHQNTFKEKVKTAWSGPNFKYWFIGGTLFVSWLAYYGLKNYKGKCVNIDILPLAPNHIMVRRKEELKNIAGILASQNAVFDERNIKKLLVYGVPASGKTMLIQDYILSTKEMQNRKKVVLPKSNINVFLQCDSVNSFLLSLKAFAAKLDITLSDLEEHIGDLSNSFFALTDLEKCDIILSAIQEAMKKHPGWVLVFDNIQTNTPKELIDMINQWFLRDENKTYWSSGTLVLLYDGKTEDVIKISDEHKYYLKNRYALLQLLIIC